MISVTAEENIKETKEFKALEINYNQPPIVPTPPAVPAAAPTTQPVK